MKRSIHRRHFLQKGALAVGALCAPFAATAEAAAGAAQRSALGFIGKYSDGFLLRGDSTGAVRFVALVRDLPRFSEAVFRARASGIFDLRVAGTVATFRAGGQLFEVENLMQHDFSARLAEQAGNLTALA